ncbi:hypothetical protein AKJ09_01785 [Labilithrix luteola]|uniref:Uncharacterized protein n=1 Tax=Labilithrix luteola TaxID=1391654 RepID=A0A0K1PNX7_9BACT|nr:hypothetical protein AKJ09_01785 [Labilithrix luteola]
MCRTAETFPLSLYRSTVLFGDDQALYVFGRSEKYYAIERAEKSQHPTFTRLVDLTWMNSDNEPTAAIVAGDDVYFGYPVGVFRLPKTGGDVHQISQQAAFAFAATATHLYVGGPGGISRMTLPDGPFEPFLDFSAGHLAIRGNDLYVAKSTYPPITPVDIVHVDLTTKIATLIGTTIRVTGLAPLDDGVIWSSGMFYSAPDVYGEHRLLRWTKSPAKTSVLFQNSYSPVTGVATNGSNIYFTNGYYWSFEQNANALVMLHLGPADDARAVPLATALQQRTQLTPSPAEGRIIVEHMSWPVVDDHFVYWLDEVEPESVNGNPELVQGRTNVRRIAIK